VTGKSTRITVDLGSDELVKALKIAAVEHRRTVRDIVVEALAMWLARTQTQAEKTEKPHKDTPTRAAALNRYRGVGDK
jgi:predicted transcriptional regulator